MPQSRSGQPCSATTADAMKYRPGDAPWIYMSPVKEMSKGATLGELLVEALAMMNPEARDKVLLAFLRSHPGTARAMLSWWDDREGVPGIPARDRYRLLRRMRSDEAVAARTKEVEAKRSLVREAKRFRADALDKKYFAEADYDDKRRAYAEGDRYLEDFYEGFVEDHDGFSEFVDLVGRADARWDKRDRDTAIRVYRALLEVYDADKNGGRLFVDEDDNPDLDIGEIFTDEARLRMRVSSSGGDRAGSRGSRKSRPASGGRGRQHGR